MTTILLSLILAVIAAAAYLPAAFLFGFSLELAKAGSSGPVIQVLAWITMILVFQPILVIPGVIIKGLVGYAIRIFSKKKAAQ